MKDTVIILKYNDKIIFVEFINQKIPKCVNDSFNLGVTNLIINSDKV